ncbi:hypothetical protein ACFL4W_05015 [Planctomycetota bacterium]
MKAGGGGDGIAVPAPNGDEGGATVTTGPDVLVFMNDDNLHGDLASIDLGGLVWKHADAGTPITFNLANIKQIKLGKLRRGAGGSGLSSARLTNGDTLMGKLVEMDEEKLVLDTWYAGRLNILRPMLMSLMPGLSKGIFVYEGPTGLQDWTVGRNRQNTWQFKKGAFYTSNYGTIGKDINLPDTANIEFELQWQNSASLTICFYTDRINNTGGNCYQMSFNGSHINMQRYSQNSGSYSLGNFSINDLRNKRKAHISIRVSKAKKTVALVMDGTLRKQWTDKEDFAGAGKGLLFSSNNSGQPMRIMNIRVSGWDGQFEGQPAASEGNVKDMVRFINNDKVSGKLVAIKEGKMVFQTEYATMNIPMTRVRFIEFSKEAQERCRRNNEDIEAFFADGGRITLKLTSLKEGQISGATENFGESGFKLEAFEKLRLNIYDERTEEEDKDEW